MDSCEEGLASSCRNSPTQSEPVQKRLESGGSKLSKVLRNNEFIICVGLLDVIGIWPKINSSGKEGFVSVKCLGSSGVANLLSKPTFTAAPIIDQEGIAVFERLPVVFADLVRVALAHRKIDRKPLLSQILLDGFDHRDVFPFTDEIDTDEVSSLMR